MNIDIFIRSYYKDFAWLSYCLRSIERHAIGFRKTIVVVPRSSMQRAVRLAITDATEIRECEDYRDDYLGQQVTKVQADKYTDADFICHVDSDCVFRRPVHPEEFFCNQRPVVSMTPYHLFPAEAGWRRLGEKFMCRDVDYDFMRRQPFVYPRWLYGAMRDHAQRLHGKSLADYITSQPARGFSEYNAFGAFAFYFHRDKFEWSERSVWTPDESICRWFWSWGGISPEVREELDALLR